MQVYLDTNILADMIIERENKQDNINALTILQLSKCNNQYGFCSSALSIATLFYLARKDQSAIEKIKRITSSITILPMGNDEVRFSVYFDYPDREDALHMSCAANNGCELILSRNLKDYTNSPLITLSPEDFLTRINSRKAK